MTTASDTAVILGLGATDSAAAALALHAAREGLQVYLVDEHRAAPDAIARAIRDAGGRAETGVLDTTDAAQLEALFARLAPPALVVLDAAAPLAAQSALQVPIAEVEAAWRRTSYRGCLVGQIAIRRMLPARRGTLLFLGHPASRLDEAGAPAQAAAGAGLRSLAQSMAREFGPQGLHVVHVLLHETANAEAAAQACWQLHRQHKTTWTQELDLRP